MRLRSACCITLSTVVTLACAPAGDLFSPETDITEPPPGPVTNPTGSFAANLPAGMALIWSGDVPLAPADPQNPDADLLPQGQGWWHYAPELEPGSYVYAARAVTAPYEALQFDFRKGVTTSAADGWKFGFSSPDRGAGPGPLNHREVYFAFEIERNPYLARTGEQLWAAKPFYLMQHRPGDLQRTAFLTSYDEANTFTTGERFGEPGEFGWKWETEAPPTQMLMRWASTARADLFRSGVRHRVEVYVKAASADGADDGVLRIWKDGTLILEDLAAPFAARPFTELHIAPIWQKGNDAATGATATYDYWLRYSRRWVIAGR